MLARSRIPLEKVSKKKIWLNAPAVFFLNLADYDAVDIWTQILQIQNFQKRINGKQCFSLSGPVTFLPINRQQTVSNQFYIKISDFNKLYNFNY